MGHSEVEWESSVEREMGNAQARVATFIVLGLFTTWFLLRVLSRRRSSSKIHGHFPPGPPRPWPLLGHLPLLIHLPHQVLAQLAKQYGPIIGLRLGCKPAVVISSSALAREVLLTHDKTFAYRPPFLFYSILFYGSENDIIFGDYSYEWRKRRKICMLELFTARRLQEFEYVRQEEMAALLQRIWEASNGGSEAVDIGRFVGVMSSNNIMRMLFSKRLHDKLPGRQTCIHDLLVPWEEEATPTIGDLIPCFKWLDILRKRKMKQIHDEFDWLLEYIIQERKHMSTTMDENNNGAQIPHDFLQLLLSREVEDVNATTSPRESLTNAELKSILLDMITAGIHTSTLTIEWAMAELLTNPSCLKKLQEEIMNVLGEGKQVNEADVSKLKYLNCVVKEVMRLHPVAPLLAPRISIQDCKIGNYILPAGTQMYINVWAIARDEDTWEKPMEFIPERFEHKEIDLKGQHFDLIPFGSGRRACLGLPLGLSTLEVTIANLVNKFRWELPTHPTNMSEKMALALRKATPMLAIPKSLVN